MLTASLGQTLCMNTELGSAKTKSKIQGCKCTTLHLPAGALVIMHLVTAVTVQGIMMYSNIMHSILIKVSLWWGNHKLIRRDTFFIATHFRNDHTVLWITIAYRSENTVDCSTTIRVDNSHTSMFSIALQCAIEIALMNEWTSPFGFEWFPAHTLICNGSSLPLSYGGWAISSTGTLIQALMTRFPQEGSPLYSQ